MEATKLVKFERYAEFTVTSLTARGLSLWATGQRLRWTARPCRPTGKPASCCRSCSISRAIRSTTEAGDVSAAGALAVEQIRAGQFWVSLGPGAGVNGPSLRDDARGVALPPAGKRDVGPFTRLTAAEHGLAAGHGAALSGVAGDRVAQIGRGELGRRVEHRPLRQLLVLKDAPHEQSFTGDRVDDEPVPVGECTRATIRSPAEARAPAASGAERSLSTRPR